MQILAVLCLAFCVGSSIAGKIPNSDADCMDSTEKPLPMCTGKGEQYLLCGEYKDCGPVCGKLNETCTIRHIQCPFGCQCPHDMAQVPGTRNCIKEDQCDQVARHCPKNMHWSDCASPCTDNCDCNLKCKGPCQKRCVCNEDYAMFENSICKPRDECEADL